MAKKTLRIGLIGCGFMGRTHSNGYNRIRNFFPELQYVPQLKAVCSRNAEKAAQFCQRYGGDYSTTDVARIMADPTIDGIYMLLLSNR